MPLNKEYLGSEIELACNSLNANSQLSASSLYSAAYHRYASMAVAGTLIAIVPGSILGLKGELDKIPLLGAGLAWASGLSVYWSQTIWADMPGISPVHIPINPINTLSILSFPSMKSELQAEFNSNRDRKRSVYDASRKIAGILHSYTTKLNVDSMIIGSPPPPIPIPIR